MAKIRLIMGDDKALAVVTDQPDGRVEITDAKALIELRELIDKRHQLGVELSRKLKANGLIAAEDDEDTVPV